MQKFSAASFFEISRLLTALSTPVREVKPESSFGGEYELLVDWLKNLERRCNDVGLRLSAVSAGRIREDLNADTTFGYMRPQILELQNRIKDELQDKLFMYVRQSVHSTTISPNSWDNKSIRNSQPSNMTLLRLETVMPPRVVRQLYFISCASWK